MKPFEYIGEWWLPENPEKTIVGTLTYSTEKGAVLELVGTFTSLKELRYGPPQYSVIRGITKKGKIITLVDCFQNRLSITRPGIDTQSFYCQYIYIGHRFFSKNPTNIKFLSIVIDFTYLLDWLEAYLQEQSLLDNEGWNGASLVARVQEYAVTSVDKVEITIGTGYSVEGSLRRKRLYRQNAYIKLTHQYGLTLIEWLTSYIRPLQDFISLATYHPNAISMIDIYPSFDDLESIEHEGEPRAIPFEVVFNRNYYDRVEEVTDIHQHEMLFTFRDIKDDFSEIIATWLKKSDELEIVRQLYFNTRYHPGFFINRSKPLPKGVVEGKG